MSHASGETNSKNLDQQKLFTTGSNRKNQSWRLASKLLNYLCPQGMTPFTNVELAKHFVLCLLRLLCSSKLPLV